MHKRTVNRFSKLFHCHNQEKICNNTVAKDPTTPQICRYTTLWNASVIKATTENKTTSVTTYFKKLTTGNNVFIVSVIVQSNCHILQVLHHVQCVHLAVGRRSQAGHTNDQWQWQVTNGTINENQLIFDEVKAFKKLCQVFGPPWCNACGMWQLL